ncbi:MAG: helix-turn-helix transcriptional regulator [Armatimonadetes bacterium]|nr:helix-turn-helix transcriptional regulator [Armatimonadota bacterium]
MDRRSELGRLTARQAQILGLIARGFTNAAIAGELRLAPKSIENYITVIYEELGIDLADASVNPRVTAVLIYLRESHTTAQQLWHQRYRGEGAPLGPGADLSEEELRQVVGGVQGAEAALLRLVVRAHAASSGGQGE